MLRLARPLLLHPGKKKKKRRKKEEEEGVMNPNGATPRPLLTPSYIICMCRIRNDIHREAVRRESWGTEKKKKEKVGREKRCAL